MKNYWIALVLLAFVACKNGSSKAPDVSGIKVNTEVFRYEKDFFGIDTTAVENGLNNINAKYPAVTPVFIGGVLGLPPDSNIDQEIKRFIRLNYPVYTSAERKYDNFDDIKKEFEKSFQYVKYYFPLYTVPKIVTIIGPIDALAKMDNGDYSTNFLGPDFMGISLQFYLGQDYSMYQAEYFINNVAPEYRSRRFDKPYIVPDAMKLVVDDLFPEKTAGRPLIEQMIEKGKQWWLLDKFLPNTADSLKMGYTQKQISWCIANEGLIWNYFTTTENLETIEPETIQLYLGESPYTQGMPESSPGNIGAWVGLQIVKKFAENNPSIALPDIMKTNPRKILEDAKYKPK